jgi:hypothetical protein
MDFSFIRDGQMQSIHYIKFKMYFIIFHKQTNPIFKKKDLHMAQIMDPFKIYSS